ncbi:MAG: SIR2 family protein [Marinifilaceae bacterium]
MKETTIEELAYIIKQTITSGQKPIFFLGAGASKSGNIPLASEISKSILSQYSDSPFIKKLDPKTASYSKLMECLLPAERNDLMKEYIEKAKINVTHIYLAQLMKEDYVDYILTVNFDNLILRALALFNYFPPTHDMAILNDLTTTTFKEKSVVYLHGQHHGLWLLNTEDEMKKVGAKALRIFDSIKNKRPWIFIGYSGEDPIFEQIEKLGRFDNGLFWVSYNDNDPSQKVKSFIEGQNINASVIKGYDSDSFMLTLNKELDLKQPSIIQKPFSCIKDLLNNIVDIDEKDHFIGVKERLEVSKSQVNDAIKEFENKSIQSYNSEREEVKINILKKEIVSIIIAGKYKEDQIFNIYEKSEQLKNEDLNKLLANLYQSWGISFGKKADNKKGKEAEILYNKAIDKFKKTVNIDPNNSNIYINWGNALANLAKCKKGEETEIFYQQAFKKFQKAIDIDPNNSIIYSNWGLCLGNLAESKKDEEAERLYEQAFQKYQKSIDIDLNNFKAYSNWGNALVNLAKSKKDEEAEILYEQALQKYQKCVDIDPNNYKAYNNWGNALANLAKCKKDEEAEILYKQAFKKFQKAVEINPDNSNTYSNWGLYLGNLAKSKKDEEAEILYKQAFKKFQKAIEIKPDNSNTYSNWGFSLGDLAKIKKDEEAEILYEQAFQKYQKSIDIDPNNSTIYSDWANTLIYLAENKKGKEAEILYEQAFQKYQKSIDIDPNNSTIYSNWGLCLGNLAKSKKDEKAERLYEQAFKKYQKCIDIDPNNYKIYNSWGNALVNLAKLKTGKEADILYEQASNKLKQAIELGDGYYNTACFYALKDDKENALKYLNISLDRDDISVSFIRKDKDWKAYYEDIDFKNLLNRFDKNISKVNILAN